MAKNRNFDSFGGCIPTFLPDKCARFHVYRGNVSPVRGEKPIFGPVSKNNTSIAVLCADLLVTKKNEQKIHNTCSSTVGARPTIPTILGMVIQEVVPFLHPLTFF